MRFVLWIIFREVFLFLLVKKYIVLQTSHRRVDYVKSINLINHEKQTF